MGGAVLRTGGCWSEDTGMHFYTERGTTRDLGLCLFLIELMVALRFDC